MDEETNERNEIGIPNGVLLLVNAIVGAGLLNFPEVYKFGGGLLLPSCLLLVFAALGLWSLLTVCYIGIKTNAETFQELLLSTLGVRAAMMCSFIISIYGFCSCTTYLIIIGDQIDRVLYDVVGPLFCKSWYFRREFTVVAFSTFIIFPNIYSKKAGFLTYVSQVGVVGIFYAVIMIVVVYFVGNYERGKLFTGIQDWNEVSYIIPTFTFAFHCHVQVMPILSCLSNKTLGNALTVVLISFAATILMYGAGGSFGYATFGDKAMSNIFLNYDASDPIVAVGTVLLCIKICCVYPLVLFCGRTAVIDLLCNIFYIEKDVHEFKLRIIVATIYHFISLSIAICVPSIGLILGFMGTIVGLFMFIFPGISSFKYKDPEANSILLKVSGVLLLIIGCLLCAFILTQSVRRAITAFSEGVEMLCVP